MAIVLTVTTYFNNGRSLAFQGEIALEAGEADREAISKAVKEALLEGKTDIILDLTETSIGLAVADSVAADVGFVCLLLWLSAFAGLHLVRQVLCLRRNRARRVEAALHRYWDVRLVGDGAAGGDFDQCDG